MALAPAILMNARVSGLPARAAGGAGLGSAQAAVRPAQSRVAAAATGAGSAALRPPVSTAAAAIPASRFLTIMESS
jgi:hypothetical protein